MTKKQEANIVTSEIKCLRSVACYRRKYQIREELNILNLNNKILKSRLQWKYHVLRMEDKLISKKILTQDET
jgi:hypothetical protein